MKLASLKKHRDGCLIVVSKDLKRGVLANNIASTMQQALDDHEQTFGRLQELYDKLNSGPIPGEFKITESELAAPLPRSYQWADGSAYVTHVELVRRARGASMPENFWTDPLMYQGAGDIMLSPTDPIKAKSASWGVDFESEIGVITSDVPMGVSPQEALNYILLFVLINDISFRNLIPKELEKGFGFFNSKPHSSLSPVAITQDELKDNFINGKINLPLYTYLNDEKFGWPNAGDDMTFSFAELISHAALTRPLFAGTIIGSGTVANKNPHVGSSCIAEKRMKEVLDLGEAKTPFLQNGDVVSIEMLDQNGDSLFGKIEQKVIIG